MSYARSTDLEVVIDHVGSLSSVQLSIVQLCILCCSMQTRLLEPAVNNFSRALAIFESSTTKAGIILLNVEPDDFNSSIFLAESIDVIHNEASLGELDLEQPSLLKFVFQITNVFGVRNFSNSIVSTCFSFGTPLFC